MVKELLYKWFGVEDFPCKSCETLREQLTSANFEKDKLLNLIIEKNKPESNSTQAIPQPIRPASIPWRVRQQMLENEDRNKAQLLKQAAEDNRKSTEELENEVGVGQDATGN